MYEVSDLSLLMITIEAKMVTHHNLIGLIDFQCTDKITRISGPGFKHKIPRIEVKKKKGRNKIKKAKKKIFQSNITFKILLNEKNYNIRFFNGGVVIGVGISQEDLSDFYECMNIITDYIIEKRKAALRILGAPEYFYDNIESIIKRDFRICSVNINLMNFHFSINRCIDIMKLERYFALHSDSIINIDLEKFHDFITRKLFNDEFDFDPEKIVESLQDRENIKKLLVPKDRLVQIFKRIRSDMTSIKLNFMLFWKKFQKKTSGRIITSMQDNIRFSYLKQYFIHYFQHFMPLINMNEHYATESFDYNQNKNTLTIEKIKDKSKITVCIFGTGNFNVLGGKTRQAAEAIRSDVIEIMREIGPDIIIDINDPPTQSWRDCLEN